MSTLERALQIAVEAHAGQKDKNGAAYIFHPLRVMGRCTLEESKMAALLHDVVEDTSVTLDALHAEGFPDTVLAAIRLLTHDKSVPYDEYVEAITTDPIAMEVKLADLEDNSDIRRLTEVDEKTAARLQKYLRAYRRLTSVRAQRMNASEPAKA